MKCIQERNGISTTIMNILLEDVNKNRGIHAEPEEAATTTRTNCVSEHQAAPTTESSQDILLYPQLVSGQLLQSNKSRTQELLDVLNSVLEIIDEDLDGTANELSSHPQRLRAAQQQQ